MITQTVDPHHYIQRARQIKSQLPILLSQWGLVSSFNRWRLARDPGTGMVVLFGVLNNKYIAAHTTSTISEYFDPRLLADLETKLHAQVLSSSNDGLHYAFVLEKGLLDFPAAPASPENNQTWRTEHKALAGDRNWLIEWRAEPTGSGKYVFVDDRAIIHKRLDKIIKITEAPEPKPQHTPSILLMGETEFNQRMAE